jgi:hypothetical protein
MNREEHIRAKALELAILAVGPLTAKDRKRLIGDNSTAFILLGQYAPLAGAIAEYLGEIPAEHTSATLVP